MPIYRYGKKSIAQSYKKKVQNATEVEFYNFINSNVQSNFLYLSYFPFKKVRNEQQ